MRLRLLLACAALCLAAGGMAAAGSSVTGDAARAAPDVAIAVSAGHPSAVAATRAGTPDARVEQLLLGLLGAAAAAVAARRLIAARTDRRFRRTRLWPRVRPALRAPPVVARSVTFIA
jgi:hypothetical protein